MTITDNGGTLEEKLININAKEHTLSYIITKNDALPVANFNATVKLTKVGKGCKINWTATFNAKDVGDSLASMLNIYLC